MNPQEIEFQIRDLLQTEDNSWILSDKLFWPEGLFGQLGPTVEDRKRIGNSPLFKEAQKRIRVLERERAQAFLERIKKLPQKSEQTRGA